MQNPGAAVLIGMVLAGMIFYFANRKVLALTTTASELLSKTQREHIAAMTAERDDYRNKLHDEKNNHQATAAKLVELRSRPDVSTLHTLLTEQSTVLRQISNSFATHMHDDSEIFKEITHALARISEKLDHNGNPL